MCRYVFTVFQCDYDTEDTSTTPSVYYNDNGVVDESNCPYNAVDYWSATTSAAASDVTAITYG